MGRLIYSMGVSLDGFIAGPAGDFDWAAPDAELHQFHNDQMREVGMHLCGRRLYETMVYWETVDPDSAIEEEFAGIWQRLPKIVYSRTLEAVVGNATLEREVDPDEVTRLKQETDVAVGGAGLAGALTDLIDEYRVFVNPVVVGGGTPFFPAARIDLELLETRTFASRVVYLRYGR